MMFFRVFVYFRLFRVLFVVLLIAVVALSPDVGDDGGRAQVAAPKGAKVSKDLKLAERRIPLEFRAKDLTVIRKSLGCVGVIGNNLLRQYAVYFDPDAKTIHLSDR